MPPRRTLVAKRPQKAAAGATAARGAARADDSDQAGATFSQFADKDDKDLIGPEGVSSLCAAMGLDPADRRVLLLAWLAGASRMGYFTRAEWLRACQRLRAGTPPAVAAALGQQLAASVDAPRAADFPSFFEFAFRYCLTDAASQKLIDLDTASQMLSLALPKGCPHTKALLEFLGVQKEYKKVNADQWKGIGRFVREVGPRCADFDDDGAWPLLLDNYVEWVRKGGGSGGGGGGGAAKEDAEVIDLTK